MSSNGNFSKSQGSLIESLKERNGYEVKKMKNWQENSEFQKNKTNVVVNSDIRNEL